MAMATARSNNFPERLLTIATGKGRLKLQNLGPTKHNVLFHAQGLVILHSFTSRFGQTRHVLRLVPQACVALTGSEDEQHLLLAARTRTSQNLGSGSSAAVIAISAVRHGQ